MSEPMNKEKCPNCGNKSFHIHHDYNSKHLFVDCVNCGDRQPFQIHKTNTIVIHDTNRILEISVPKNRLQQPTVNGERLFVEDLTDEEIEDWRKENVKEERKYMQSRGYP
jgi:hypothetical protein